jgi:hypothetical protein
MLEPARPFVIAAGRVDELHGDAQLIAGFAHTPLHHGRDRQFPPHFAHVYAGVAKPEGATAA